MSLSLADISAVLNIQFGDQISDQFRRDVLMPNLLAVESDRNAVCTWPAKFDDRDTAGPRGEGHDAVNDDFSAHLRKQASLPWATYQAFAKVSGLAQSTAGANTGLGVDADLLEEEVGDALDEMAAVISQHTYAGNATNSPTEFEGLARAVDSTGTYAGLAQGTYADWASGEETLATGSLSLENLRTKLHRPFKDATGAWPEFVVCSGALWDKTSALFNDNSRQFVDTISTSARGAVNLRAVGGFRAIMVDGVPYVEDRHCTANTFYALHSRWLSYRQVPSKLSRMHPSHVQKVLKELTGMALEEDDVLALLRRGNNRLQPEIIALAQTGDSFKVMMKVYAQLRLKRRNAAAKLVLT